MSNTLTLRTFFESVYAPTYLAGAKPKTFAAYREAIKHWARVHGETLLRSIGVEQLAQFKAALLEGRLHNAARQVQRTFFEIDAHEAAPLARATVNKHLRALQAMLGKAGPPGPRNRDALAILPAAPWVKPLREPKRLPRAIRAQDLAAVYQACDAANWPKLNVYAADWWRALLVTAYTTAFRHHALMTLEWKNVDLPAATIRIEPDGDKCLCARSKPLHRAVVLHLMRIRTNNRQVFPWPHSNKTWYRQWHELQNLAEIPAERRFTLHDLKRTAGTIYAATSSPWVVQLMMDHSNIETSRHYIDPSDQLRLAVDTFPLPPQMLAEVGEPAAV